MYCITSLIDFIVNTANPQMQVYDRLLGWCYTLHGGVLSAEANRCMYVDTVAPLLAHVLGSVLT